MVESGNRSRSELLNQRVKRYFAQRAKWAEPWVQALRSFRAQARNYGWPAFLFGGVPRSLLVHGASSRLRDFDIVVDDAAFRELRRAWEGKIRRLNRFGGVNMLINGIDFDVWPLSSTWAFREKIISKISFESLPKTAFLNIDSIVVELAPRRGRPRRIFDAGFFNALSSRILDVQLYENPFPDLAAVRTLRLAQTLGFRTSIKLSEYVLEALHRHSSETLTAVQQRHYGNVFLSESDLDVIKHRLEGGLMNNSSGSILLFDAHKRQCEFWEVDSWSTVLGFQGD